MLYIPNLPYAFYLAYKAKHLAFFTAANPSIKSSGNGTESKFATMYLIPEQFRPKSILVLPKTRIDFVIQEIDKAKISYPLIAKPDVGFRGLLVKKINSREELLSYLKKYPINIIVQEYIDYKNECGIFYYRNPNEATGKITSITLKKFLSVTGNGYSTLRELVLKDNRAKIYFDIINDTHPLKLNTIPKKNEIIKLSVIGNHCKGTQFINGNHLISKELHKTFDKINKSIDGWYYGRLDIKYNTFSELQKGINLKILEINGILAEPTHIYDSKNYNYLKALKEIRKHWSELYDIAITNHTQFNVPYKSTKLFIYEMLRLKNYVTIIKKLD